MEQTIHTSGWTNKMKIVKVNHKGLRKLAKVYEIKRAVKIRKVDSSILSFYAYLANVLCK